MAQDSGAPRFTAIEEVKPRPYPIVPIPPSAWTPAGAKVVWARMAAHPWMLDDRAKGQFKGLMRGTLDGKVHWFELGKGLGLAHVYGGEEDGVADINVEMFGNRRRFLRVFGKSSTCRSIWVEAIMKWLKLRKLRAHVAVKNTATVRLIERCGFVREGWLRKEWIINGQPEDVYVYGLLRDEVK